MPSTPPSRFGISERAARRPTRRAGGALDVEARSTARGRSAGSARGLDVQHRRRDTGVLHEQPDRVLAHRDAHGRRHDLAEPVGIARLCVSVLALTNEVSLPDTTVGATGERPPGSARFEAAARHQEVASSCRPTARTASSSAAPRSSAGRRPPSTAHRPTPGRPATRPMRTASADVGGDECDRTGEPARSDEKGHPWPWGRSPVVCEQPSRDAGFATRSPPTRRPNHSRTDQCVIPFADMPTNKLRIGKSIRPP